MTSLMTSLFNLAICGMAAAYMYEKWQARNKGGTNPENESEASQPKRAKGQQSGQFQLHKDLGIEVLGTQFEAPDSDGDSSASVIFSTENSSKHDLERFIARIWFETTDGHLLGGGLAEIEESVSTEDTSSMTANVNLIRLGGRTEGVRTHLSIIGCSAQRTKLERRTLPRDEGEEFVIFQSKSLAEGLTIEKVTVVISENEDGGGQLKLFYLVRNETFRSFPHIEIKTKLLSKTGKDLELTETAESIQPFSVGVIYDYIVLEKLSVLKNCQIECEAVVYEPVVIGEAQGTSMAILEAEHNDDDDDNDTYENSDSEDDAAEEDSQDELDTAESGDEDEDHDQETGTEVFMVRNLNIGFIPKEWTGNEEKGDVIEIGNPQFSLVKELSVSFGEDGKGRLDGDEKKVFSEIEELYDETSEDLKALAKLLTTKFGIKVSCERLAKAIRVVAAGSDDWISESDIEFITEDGPEICDGQSYLGKIYVHCFDLGEEKDRVAAVNTQDSR